MNSLCCFDILFTGASCDILKQHAFFCGEGSRSRCYGRTAALRRTVQPCHEDD
jgi:hypothetical protein